MTDAEEIAILKDHINELLKQIENMKNAGNCCNYRQCENECRACAGCKNWRLG